MAILVLPFNSALNPFLYTFNILMEKRAKKREEKLLKKLEMRTNSDVTKAVVKVTKETMTSYSDIEEIELDDDDEQEEEKGKRGRCECGKTEKCAVAIQVGNDTALKQIL